MVGSQQWPPQFATESAREFEKDRLVIIHEELLVQVAKSWGQAE